MAKLLVPDGFKLFPFQKKDCKFFVKNKGGFLAHEMGCVSGDAVVTINQNGSSRKYTLREAYEKFNRSWDLTKVRKIRSWNGETIQLNPIRAIISQGYKKVLRIHTPDESIEVTPDHEILTQSYGWVAAQDLLPHHKVATDTPLPTRGPIKPKNRYPLRQVPLDYPAGHITTIRGAPYRKRERHILLLEAHMNGLELEDYIEDLYSSEDLDEFFVIDSSKFHVHHRDGDHKNNNLTNLELLCRKQHMRQHGKVNIKNFGQGEIVYKQITSLYELEESIDVYDIVCEDPHRNFVANNIVVHNCGKTIIGIVSINSIVQLKFKWNKDNPKVLIICPAIMRDTWAAEWKKWSYFDWNIEVIDDDTPKDKWGRRFPDPETNVLIVSYNYISNKRIWKKFQELYDFDFIVADEWHYCKNLKAARTKKALLLMRKAKYKFVLTGTPYCRNVMDLYSQLIPFVPAEELGKRLDDFGHQFSYLIDNGYGMNWEGLQNEERLIEMCRPFMKRRLFHKTIKDLPPLTIKHIPVNIQKSVAKKSLKFVDIALQKINGQKAYVDPDLKDHVSTMKMQLGISKCRAAVEYTLLKLEGVECLLLAAYHKDVIAVLQNSLKKKKVICRAITGATPDKKRQMYIRNFQKGKYQVLIVQMKAGGVGITLTRAHYGIAAELDWSPNIMNQVMRRNYRIGQKYPCQWDWLVGKNSLDSQILPSLNEKTRLGIRALGDTV